MALKIESAKLLAIASKREVNFDSCLMIGRQASLISKKEKDLISKNYPSIDKDFLKIDRSKACRLFFNTLGAKEVQSLDFAK